MDPAKEAAKVQAYRLKYPERVREARIRDYWKDHERSREYQREWQAKNRAKMSAYHLKWVKKNREKTREAARNWRKKHPEVKARYRESKKLKSRVYRAANREKLNAIQRERRKKNPEYQRLRHLAYIRKYPEKNRHNSLKYYNRKRGAEGSFTLSEWRALLARYDHKCAYCGKPITGRDATRDHKIPLSRGGAGDISNIVPACRSCNSAKHTRTHEEFKPSRSGEPAQR